LRNNNIIPVTLALILHVVVFGSLLVVLDFSDRDRLVIPLAIKGTLVTDNAIVIPPEPDTSEQDRLRAEQQKRLDDARIERERLSRIEQQKKDRKKADAAAERKRQEDADKRRLEAERAREAEVERQRRENERVRAEVQAARQEELDAESSRLDAMTANAKEAYMFAIRQRVMSRWVRPASATVGIECIAHIKQLPGGEVISVRMGRCNGDAAVRRSIEAAIHGASPLPTPRDPSVLMRTRHRAKYSDQSSFVVVTAYQRRGGTAGYRDHRGHQAPPDRGGSLWLGRDFVGHAAGHRGANQQRPDAQRPVRTHR
jgi:colicin import membrane protein